MCVLRNWIMNRPREVARDSMKNLSIFQCLLIYTADLQTISFNFQPSLITVPLNLVKCMLHINKTDTGGAGENLLNDQKRSFFLNRLFALAGTLSNAATFAVKRCSNNNNRVSISTVCTFNDQHDISKHLSHQVSSPNLMLAICLNFR